MNYVHKIDKLLRECFEPIFLEVIDESESHRGHTGFKEGTQTHFKIVISAKIFEKMCLRTFWKPLPDLTVNVCSQANLSTF